MNFLQLGTYLIMLCLHIFSWTAHGPEKCINILAFPKEIISNILNQIYQDKLSNFKKICETNKDACYPDYTKDARSLCCVNSTMYFTMTGLKIQHILRQYTNQNPFLRKAYIPPLRIQSSSCGGNTWIILCPNSETFYAGFDLRTDRLPKRELLKLLSSDPDREVKCDNELKALQINSGRLARIGKYPNSITPPNEFVIAFLGNDIKKIETILTDYSNANESMQAFLSSSCFSEIQDISAMNWLKENQKFVDVEKLVRAFIKNCFEKHNEEENRIKQVKQNEREIKGGNSNKSYFEKPLLILVPLVPIILSLLYLFKKPIMDIMLKNY